jgi:hypothetical protein
MYLLIFNGNPGESGKSTIFKQMKVIYGVQYTVAERKQQIPTIHSNVLQGIKVSNVVSSFGVKFYCPLCTDLVGPSRRV